MTEQKPVALVTGGVRRIGAVLVERLARAGFAVVIGTSARSVRDAAAVQERLRGDGLFVSHVIADLADPSSAETLVGDARRPFGPITLLVNNAAVFENDEASTLDAETFDRHVAVNLRAPLLLARHFAAQAPAEHSPSIVNMLDQRVLAPNPLFFSYSVSKAGLAAATTTLAQALAPGIRVNAIAPGPVLPNAQDGVARFEAEVARVPLEHAVAPNAIADALLYLAAARSVTGQVLAVDGGQRLAWKTPDVLASMDLALLSRR